MAGTTVILNPIAGRGAGARLSREIRDRLRSHGLGFELIHTCGPGHATDLAREAVANGSDCVVAVGGDGTSNEVLNGLMEAGAGPSGPALGILPIGTGNDLAFSAGLSLDLREAYQVISGSRSRVFDVGWIRADNEAPRYFGNGTGMGFDAMANIESRKITRLRGFAVYLIAVLKTLTFYYQAPLTTIQVDDQTIVQPSLLVSIMNGHRVGGSFYVTPDAEMDDGVFDVCIGRQMSRLRMVGFVPQFLRGTHTGDKLVTMARGRRVMVDSETPWAAHVDGEIYGVGARRYEVEILPQRLRLQC
jgi:YegS/Rv2252/BmrU family lipid kinase